MAALTFSQLQDALQKWVVAASGLADTKVNWVNQPGIKDGAKVNPVAVGAPQPTRPFITLQIITTSVLGRAGGEKRHTTPTTVAPNPVSEQTVSMRRGTLAINAYSESSVDYIEAIRDYRDECNPVQASVAATSQITIGAIPSNGETFRLVDGKLPAANDKTFEFHTSAPVSNVFVDLTGAATIVDVRAAIITAITGLGGWPELELGASIGPSGVGTESVTLTHLRPGAAGNESFGVEALTDFAIAEFSGGSDSDVAFGPELGSQDQTSAQDSLFSARSRIDLEFGYLLRKDDPDAGAIEQVQFRGTLGNFAQVVDVDLTQA